MLPAGLSADAADAPERRRLADVADPAWQTVRLRVGACACGLFLDPANDGRSEESLLRARYFTLGVPRDAVIHALDRHRGGRPLADTAAPRDRRARLAAFVAEHTRTAGSAVFLRSFQPSPMPPALVVDDRLRRAVAAVTAAPCDWLPEDRAVEVHA